MCRSAQLLGLLYFLIRKLIFLSSTEKSKYDGKNAVALTEAYDGTPQGYNKERVVER